MSRNQREGYFFGKFNGRICRRHMPTKYIEKYGIGYRKQRRNIGAGPVSHWRQK